MLDGRNIGVLWDMDGVIVDSGDAHFKSWKKALEQQGIHLDRKFFDETFGMNNRGILTLILKREPTEQEVTEIAELKESLFREDVRGKLEPLPGVLDWLGRFADAGFPQAVASSAPQANVDAIVEGLGLENAFQALVSGSSLPGKPDPSTFLLAAERLGKGPGDCLVLEDAKVGVRAAKAAGMRCVAVCTTHQAFELTEADLVVDRLTDLTPDGLAAIFC